MPQEIIKEIRQDATGKFASELTPEALAHRQMQAYKMRLAGATYSDIGAALKMDRATVARDVKTIHDIMRSQEFESITEMRAMSAARLDKALFALMPFVIKGDLKAIRTLTLLEKRRAELFGLDAPKKFEHTGENGSPIEMNSNSTVNIREQWTPQEAAARATELHRRLEVINRETQRQQELQKKHERN